MDNVIGPTQGVELNWNAIVASSEFVGAFIAIVALMYLALQIRRNAKAIRSSTTHDIMEEIRSIYALMAEHKEIANLVHRAATDADSITGDEKVQWYALNMNFMRALENAYFQWTEGTLDSRVWEGFRKQFADYSRLPGFQDFWTNRKHWFDDHFCAFFEREMSRPPIKEDIPIPGDY